MVAERFVGVALPTATVTIEPGQIALFCKAIGETGAEYQREAGAGNAGLPAILAPPTFGFTVKALTGQPFTYLTDMGFDIARLLHGSQSFDYHAPLWSGDDIEVATTIEGLEQRGGGRFTAVNTRTDLRGLTGDLRVRLTSVWLLRNDGPDAA